MPRKKPPFTCSYDRCSADPYRGGLCEEHYGEKCVEEELRSSAIRSLHRLSIDGSIPKSEVVRDELLRIGRWWTDICMTVQSGGRHLVLGEEIAYAQDWCIRLSEQLVLFERAVRSGTDLHERKLMLHATRTWVWERFENLEKGLMSNGIPRPLR